MKEKQNFNIYQPPLYCKDCMQHAPFMNQGNLYEGAKMHQSGMRMSREVPKMPQLGQPMPYYMAYPNLYWGLDEMDEENDLERIKSMFPRSARMIQPEIEEACDRLEYEGSMMFDEYPDRVMMEKIVDDIYEKVQQQQITENVAGQEESEEVEKDIFTTDCKNCGKHNFGTMKELISVMLFEEMFRRRARHRRNRNRWF